MHAQTLPPYRHVSSRTISLEDGSALLAKYLANSERHAHLHPDALITPSGASFSASGGPSGGVVMHNLRRVAAGLRGEYLEPEPSPEPEEQGASSKGDWKGKKSGGAEETWQDMSEFEKEEGAVEVGEIGARTNFVQEGGEAPELEAADEDGQKKRKQGDDSKLDKEARKKAKKAKDKEFRAKKEKERLEKAA